MSDVEREDATQPAGAAGESPGENFDLDSLRTILEGILLAAARPLNLDQLQTLLGGETGPGKDTLRRALSALEDDCAHRGVELVEVASGFRLQVRQELQPWVTKLWEERPPRYSRALLETLALIAYRQPITRGEIEDVRGVSVSTNIIRQLEEREWIRVVGHRDVPGKPALFGTTKAFLDYFGLKNLDDLPSLAELRDIESLEPELDFSGGSDSKGEQPGESDGGATDEAEAMALAAESDEETGTDGEGQAEASRDEEDATAEVQPDSAGAADDETPARTGAVPDGEGPDADAETPGTEDEAEAPEAAEAKHEEPETEPAEDRESGDEPAAGQVPEAEETTGDGDSEDADAGTHGEIEESGDAPRDESPPEDDESRGSEAASGGRR